MRFLSFVGLIDLLKKEERMCQQWTVSSIIPYLIAVVFSCVSPSLHSAETKDEVSTNYKGIPGCSCFHHCSCFSREGVAWSFPPLCGKRNPPPCNVLWHQFMPPYLDAIHENYFMCHSGAIFDCSFDFVESFIRQGSTHLLSEYLNAIRKLGNQIERTRKWKIQKLKEKHSKPAYQNEKDQNLLAKSIELINKRANRGFELLSSIPPVIIPLYRDIIDSCPHKSSHNIALIYNSGLIDFIEGDVDGSLDHIEALIQFAKNTGNENILTSEIFLRQGESYFEMGLYHEAILALSEAINKDPSNLEAYFQRASAYFELGDFELSLSDYLVSKKTNNISPMQVVSPEFLEAFINSSNHGAEESLTEFIPSLCYTAYGIEKCLWAIDRHPIESTLYVANACKEAGECIFEYFETLDKEKLNNYADELVQLYQRYQQLSDTERGDFLGYTIGKYGTDILLGGEVIKSIGCARKLQEANRICNLEAMALSSANKEAIITAAVQHSELRAAYFRNVVLEMAKQEKHIIGTNNYLPGKSIFEHKNPEALLKKFAGTGKSKNTKMGKPGFKEKVDFKERIGTWVSKDGSQSLPTTKGIIHYSDNGAHIVPAYPD